MALRSGRSFDDLANWGDANAVSPSDDDQNPIYLDPRPIPLEIVSIDNDIASLAAKLNELTVLRGQLLASRALITHVPPELLSRIFELTIHVSPALLPTLSLVSRTWHAIVLSTPCLHTYIKMDDTWGYHGDDARPPSEAFLDRTRLQLSRSCDAKLYIDIDFRYLDNMADVRAIMKELQPHLQRAFFFRASLPDWDWMMAVRDHSALLGPSLEELYLHIDSADSEDQSPITFLSAPCPRLNKIILEHTPLTCIRPHADTTSAVSSTVSSSLTLPPPEVSLPTTLHPSLQHLHLIRDTRSSSTSSRFSIPFSLLLTTLSTTPTLRTLHIQSAFFLLTGSEQIFQPQPTKLCMPHLEELTFNFVDTTNVGLFLENVDCQGLRTLRIQMDSSNGTEDSVGFLARVCAPSPGSWTALYPMVTIPHQPLYIRSPFPALRHLDLRSIYTTGPSIYPFIRALHSLPHLTALALSSPPSGCFGARIWELLGAPCVPTSLILEGTSSGKDKQTWILPALQALIVQSARDVSGHEILRVVRARKAAFMGARGLGEGSWANGEGAADGMRGERVEDDDAPVAQITYLKILGCYTFDRDGEIAEELKRVVRRVLF